MSAQLLDTAGWQATFDGSRRWMRANAVLCWLIAASVWGVQLVVVFHPQADIIRLAFPDWPVDLEYQAYLRGIALADVVFLQPLLAFTGIGLWRMRRWGLVCGVAVAGTAVYFGILQVAAELFIGSRYHLYGMGALAVPFSGTPLYELGNWVGVLSWVIYPALLGLYCFRKLSRNQLSPPS
ncbi:MAG: hypothetical protein GY832_12545 [Chloroflexi bacterium]|nr:hypothetical protein [Chloroflexota bacterium]